MDPQQQRQQEKHQGPTPNRPVSQPTTRMQQRTTDYGPRQYTTNFGYPWIRTAMRRPVRVWEVDADGDVVMTDVPPLELGQGK
ncbi:hypothetical protein CMUS01_12497 [Colletotrichum musicola]|uniref:Uncharacterized protein n=1 Tax=Colletotrichum musicola TaxID=2175873 RepID=A0A8H6JL48_9PEZI|nr:hypothetical protein CMUS01_12497 [Colletotrichum musicola]